MYAFEGSKREVEAGSPHLWIIRWIKSPGICEILGHAGFDYCIIDLEHGAIDLETAENMIRGAKAAGIAPIVRVAANRAELIGQALDEQLEYTFQQSAQPKRHKKPSGRLSSHYWADGA